MTAITSLQSNGDTPATDASQVGDRLVLAFNQSLASASVADGLHRRDAKARPARFRT